MRIFPIPSNAGRRGRAFPSLWARVAPLAAVMAFTLFLARTAPRALGAAEGASPAAVAGDRPAADATAAGEAGATGGEAGEAAAEGAGTAESGDQAIKGSSWWDRIVKSSMGEGGAIMWILGLCSILGLGFALERLVFLRRRDMVPPHLAREAMALWDKGDRDGILALCHRHPSTLAAVIHGLVSHRHCANSELSQIAGDTASRAVRIQLQKIYPLQVIAALSPLLGLLGTVVGMVLAFEKVSGAGSLGNASILADDISLALMTTMAGLIIAVPMLVFYHFFRSRTLRYAFLLESETNALMARWFLSDSGRQDGAA